MGKFTIDIDEHGFEQGISLKTVNVWLFKSIKIFQQGNLSCMLSS